MSMVFVLALQVDKLDLFTRSRHYVAPRIQTLQTFVVSASRTATIFSSQLASARLSFMRQHAVNDAAVLPAAALAEMATAAVRLLGEDAGSSGNSAAVAAMAVAAAPRLAACDILTTSIGQDGSVCIAAADGATLATAHGTIAPHLSTETAASAGATKQPTAAPGPLERVIRGSPVLADAAAPSKPLAALRLSPGAEDGFWVHPGLLSAALVLADTCEQRAGSAHLLLAIDCYAAADAIAATTADIWASAAEASGADIRASEQHTASMQIRAGSFASYGFTCSDAYARHQVHGAAHNSPHEFGSNNHDQNAFWCHAAGPGGAAPACAGGDSAARHHRGARGPDIHPGLAGVARAAAIRATAAAHDR